MKDINISNHFIIRFNERYMKQNYQWTIKDLRSYLDRIITSTQLNTLNKLNGITGRVRFGLGKHYDVIMEDNTLITILYR